MDAWLAFGGPGARARLALAYSGHMTIFCPGLPRLVHNQRAISEGSFSALTCINDIAHRHPQAPWGIPIYNRLLIVEQASHFRQ